MAESSSIEWTDATWNPVTGCSVVSPGCTNCYAMKLAGTRLKGHPSRAGLTADSKAGPVWTGEVRFNEQWLDQPLRWSRPRRIFVCAHGDLFHESVPFAVIDRIFAVMALAPQHTFQVLTKRADRMRMYVTDRCQARADGRGEEVVRLGYKGPLECLTWPLPNVWLGISAENQAWLDLRAPHLLETPAAVRFVSAEPLLQPLDLEPYLNPASKWSNRWLNNYPLAFPRHQVDLVIVGGENGPRPMHPDWVRDIRDDCAEAGVPFFFKQWGSWAEVWAGPEIVEVDADDELARDILADVKTGAWVTPAGERYYRLEDLPADETPCRLMERVGKKAAGRLLDGVLHDAMPEVRS